MKPKISSNALYIIFDGKVSKVKNCGYTQLYLKRLLIEGEITEFDKMEFRVPKETNYLDYKLKVSNNIQTLKETSFHKILTAGDYFGGKIKNCILFRLYSEPSAN
jgi:hypothetical protein